MTRKSEPPVPPFPKESEPVKHRDFPFDDVCVKANEFIERGMTVYQKYTCSGCGSRLGIEEPNKFYETGTCDKCSTITNIRSQGCNFLLVTGRLPPK